MPIAMPPPLLRLAVILVATLAASGCARWIMQNALANVKAQLPDDSPIKSRLKTTSNPRGAGILVYVPSTEVCGPEYLWIGGRNTYAVDRASQALTPDWRRVNEASAEVQHTMGADEPGFEPALRQYVCDVEGRNEQRAASYHP